MHILITGVAGFIGSNLARALLERNYQVTGVDNFSQGFQRNVADLASDPRFHLVEGDVRDEGLLSRAAKQADAFVHLAAYKIPRYGNTLATLEINAHGTRNVLKVATEGKRRIVAASTSDVYGCNPAVPFNESSELWLGPTTVPRWAYAVSKLFDEQLAFAYWREKQVPVVMVRFFGGYGPAQNTSWWGGPQSVFIDAALNNQTMQIHGDGQQTRSFTYISDHVAGLVQCIERPEAVGHAFNLGNNREITILGLAELIWGMIRDDVPKYELVPYQTFGKYQDVLRRVPDITKTHKLLGVKAKVELEHGLSKTIDWQRALAGDENG